MINNKNNNDTIPCSSHLFILHEIVVVFWSFKLCSNHGFAMRCLPIMDPIMDSNHGIREHGPPGANTHFIICMLILHIIL